MVEKRRIRFKHEALKNPGVLNAMSKEGMPATLSPDARGDVDYFDETGIEFPHLRKALKAGDHAFDEYQQRHTDGDHQTWRKTRAGITTIVENGGIGVLNGPSDISDEPK